MIEHLRHMAIFARVVDEGSFRAAAKAIGLAPSRVSETVSDLENFLGVTLLYRTTRKIALTNEGRMFYARATEMLRSAETGLNELNALSLATGGRAQGVDAGLHVIVLAGHGHRGICPAAPAGRAVGQFHRRRARICWRTGST